MASAHDRVVIISTGDEIVVGQLLDTNSKFLAEKLVGVGVLPVEHVTVPDELPAIVETLRRACKEAPLVIMSGGLGPTDGDLTRHALAALLGEKLVLDAGARAQLAGLLARRGREMTARQERQAFRPESAKCMANEFGTAPGLHAVVRSGAVHVNSDVFCLPGPPGELRPMFERQVLTVLRPLVGRVVVTRLLHVVGVPEADCVDRLGDLTRRDRNPLVGVTASSGVLTVRIRYDGDLAREAAAALVDQAEAKVEQALGDHLFAKGEGPGVEMLARTLLGLLTAKGRTLSVVESCTGGMLGQMLTAIPGASASFVGGEITYSDGVKKVLGVSGATLEAHGAVSAETCREMAERGLERFGSDYAIAITGIAGPDGGSERKPLGTTFVGVAGRGKGGEVGEAGGRETGDVRRFLFTGGREDVRRRACVTAMAMLYFSLRGRHPGGPKLLWQVG